MIKQVFAIGIAVGFARDPGGCGGGESQPGGIHAPCTRPRDCGQNLRCVQGVCEEGDGGGADAAQMNDAPGDG